METNFTSDKYIYNLLFFYRIFIWIVLDVFSLLMA